MARFVCRKFAKLNFEPLEDRTTPTVGVSIVGNVVTFTGDGANDPLGLNISGNGYLQHTLQVGLGNGLPETSEDLDPNTVGVQRRTPASLTSLVVNLGGGTDSVSIADVAVPTTLSNTENVQLVLSGAANATLTNNNVAITFPVLGTFNYGVTGHTLIVVDGGQGANSGPNLFDASAVTTYGVVMRGYDGNDTLRGGAMPDRLEGGEGDDVLEGNGGDDNNSYYPLLGTSGGLYGGNGNDILRGGAGNDYLEDIGPMGAADGGTGTDFYFIYAAAGAVVTNTNLSIGGASSVGMGFEGLEIDGDDNPNVLDASGLTTVGIHFRGMGGSDTIYGSQMPDRLDGDNGNDIIYGNDGDDTNSYLPALSTTGGLYGGNDNDTIYGGNGNDYIEDIGPDGAADGGAGNDYYYAYLANGCVITNTTLRIGAGTSVGNNIEAIHIDGDGNNSLFDASAYTLAAVWMTGGDGNDTLYGGSMGDRLDGGNGDDIIEGRDGDDSNSVYNNTLFITPGLYGGYGNDTIRGGNGNDYIEDIGPDGAADGGAGNDYFYGYLANGCLITNSTFKIGAGTSVGNNLEAIHIDGDGNNSLFDASAYTTAVWIAGGDGNDTIYGSTQGDRLDGGNGDDLIEGRDGDDSNSVYNNTLFITPGLYGGYGNDTIRGGNGNDYIEDIGPDGAADGGAGNDYYYAYLANGCVITNTTFRIGAGTSVGNTIEAIHIDGDANNSLFDASGYTTAVWLTGGDGNDTLYGSTQADRLDGGNGDDIVEGRDGDDNNSVYNSVLFTTPGLYGGNGNDTLRGGNGNDYLEDIGPDGAADGGAGTDFLFIYNVAAAVITDTSLAFGMATSVGNGLEGVRIDGTPGNDTFNATGFTLGSVWFRGNDGNDTLRGGEQPDRLEGGYGDDLLFGNGGDDNNTFLAAIGTVGGLYADDGFDTVDGGAGNDLLDGSTGNDILTGGPGNDLIYGGDGDDILHDGPETNTLVGDAGTDSIRLTATSGADLILVADGSVTINGAVTAYSLSESLIIDAGAGVDEGTQVGATHPLAYVVNNLEPTVFGGPDVTTTAVPFIRTGTFKDIGAGQNTWIGQADYGEGAGFEPITVDSFNKSFSLNHSYSAGGSFLVRIRITDQQGNTGESSFTVFRPAGVQVGVGGVQRSMIPKLTVSFDGLYTINPGYFTFQRLFNGTSPSVNAVISTLNNKTVITMTFSGAIEANTNSLLDGDYRLTLDSTKILTNPGGQQFDGNGDGSPGGAFVFNFHRLVGDGNGDRTVDGADLVLLGNAFSTSSTSPLFNAAFDLNVDNTVDGADLVRFGNNFGRQI